MQRRPSLPLVRSNRFGSIVGRLAAYTIPLLIGTGALLGVHRSSDTVIHGFTLQDSRYFPEHNFTVDLYVHEKHQSPFLNIRSSDSHNFFAVTFRTTCLDDTGSTHVLEHLALQGSKNFPIRSIFSEMIKRSPAVFMNAFTSIEWTAYPFSTTNEKDFHNLLSVYLDAAFNPELNETAFESECHHLEFEKYDDSATNLIHSGVVYNEMNGDTSNPSSRFSNLVREHLYPDSVFGLQYGGNPPSIATLTVEKIREQHARYYHPCNSIFFHYGSFPVDRVLEKVASVIDVFDEGSVEISEEQIAQPRWNVPRVVEQEGPAEGDDGKVRVSSSWIVGDLRNVSETADLSFMALLLTYSNRSPLYQGLIKSGFGTKFIETGFFPYMRSPYFGIGLEGVSRENATKFPAKVIELLRRVCDDGFDKDLIEGILHQEELSEKGVSGSEGIRIWERVIGNWIHGVSVFELIDMSWEIDRIRNILKLQPRYFEMILRRRLIENRHRLDLTMKGVEGFQKKLSDTIQAELATMKEKMTLADKEKIIERSKAIRSAIDAPKQVDRLPAIKASELSTTERIGEFMKDGQIFKFVRATNGIVHIRAKCELRLNNDDLPFIPLLSSVMTDVGADDLDDEAFTKRRTLETGGIHSELKVVSTNEGVKTFIVISGSCLARNTDKLIELMRKVMTRPRLDNKERIAVLISMASAGISESVIDSGHVYARRRSMAEFSDAAALDELWFGVTYLKQLQEIARKKDWDWICQLLQGMFERVYKTGVFSGAVHGQDQESARAATSLKILIGEINRGSATRVDLTTTLAGYRGRFAKDTLINVDTSSFFCAMTIPYDKGSGHAKVAASVLADEFLFESIREKLGAYGAMATYNEDTGVTSLMSYRDTNPTMVLQAMESALRDVNDGHLTAEMVERGVVRVVAKRDAPLSPSDEDVDCFYDEALCTGGKQRLRTNILKSDVSKVSKVVSALHEGKARKRIALVGVKGTEGTDTFDVLDLTA